MESGSGIASLRQAASKITTQYNSDKIGTKYQMTVEISGIGLGIALGVRSANAYLQRSGVKPWPGAQSVAARTGSNSVLFRWLR